MEIPCSYGNDDYNKNEYLEHIVQSLNNNTNSAVHNLTHTYSPVYMKSLGGGWFVTSEISIFINKMITHWSNGLQLRPELSYRPKSESSAVVGRHL